MPAPSAPQAAFEKALDLHQAGQLAEAEQIYRSILRTDPSHFDAANLLGLVLLQKKDAAGSERQFSVAIAINPKVAAAHANRGNALATMSRFDEALASYAQAIALDPRDADIFNNRGHVLRQLSRDDEALASYDQAIALEPHHAGTHNHRGNVLSNLGRYLEALESYERAIAIDTDFADAHFNRGAVLEKLIRPDEALASYDRAIALNPRHAVAHCNRGAMLLDLKRYPDALESCERAIALNPGLVLAHSNRGALLHRLRRYPEALASCDRAILLDGGLATAHCNRGAVLECLEQYPEALASFERAVVLDPGLAAAYGNCGNVLHQIKRLDEAVAAYDKALARQPDLKYAEGLRLHTKMHICDWSNFDVEAAHLIDAVRKGANASQPFEFLALPTGPADQQRCAELYIADQAPATSKSFAQGVTYSHDRARIAYLSADFRDHAVAYYVLGLLERHDRTRFEITGISTGPDDQSPMREQLQQAFDRFIDVRNKNDLEVARLLRELEIDIAVDLTGLTANNRPGILAHRPAPIQVNFLGYPGTMGANYIDYMVADRIVLPDEHRRYFHENVVYLPDSYLGDTGERPDAATPSRTEAGLPAKGFVFCSFNGHYKITPDVFDIWMRLLRDVEGSVLWLPQGNSSARANLGREAKLRGVSSDRLIFAPRKDRKDHLARHRLADLFLDTLPYNAHSTASDALWSGLPVLTCIGSAFPGRVGASLLNAIGLPELVTASLQEYETMALKLARDPTALASLKEKLARNRGSFPLFDAAGHTRHVETAFSMMLQRHQRGEPPGSFAVERFSPPPMQ